MTLQAGTQRRFDIGGVLGNIGRAVSQNAGTFFGLSILLYGLPLAIIGALQFVMMRPMLRAMAPGAAGDPSAMFGPDFVRNMLVSMGTGLFSLVLLSVLQAAVIHGVVSSLLGRRASINDCLRTGLRFLVPAVLIGIVTAVGAFFGFLLLIVPGVILALGWSVSVPVAVAEEKGVFASIGRSWQLTNGYKGQIFLIALIYVVIMWIAGMLISGIGMPIMMANIDLYFIVVGILLTPILNSVTSVIGAAGVASIYYELRQVKEGIGAESLASVFA